MAAIHITGVRNCGGGGEGKIGVDDEDNEIINIHCLAWCWTADVAVELKKAFAQTQVFPNTAFSIDCTFGREYMTCAEAMLYLVKLLQMSPDKYAALIVDASMETAWEMCANLFAVTNTPVILAVPKGKVGLHKIKKMGERHGISASVTIPCDDKNDMFRAVMFACSQADTRAERRKMLASSCELLAATLQVKMEAAHAIQCRIFKRRMSDTEKESEKVRNLPDKPRPVDLDALARSIEGPSSTTTTSTIAVPTKKAKATAREKKKKTPGAAPKSVDGTKSTTAVGQVHAPPSIKVIARRWTRVVSSLRHVASIQLIKNAGAAFAIRHKVYNELKTRYSMFRMWDKLVTGLRLQKLVQTIQEEVMKRRVVGDKWRKMMTKLEVSRIRSEAKKYRQTLTVQAKWARFVCRLKSRAVVPLVREYKAAERDAADALYHVHVRNITCRGVGVLLAGENYTPANMRTEFELRARQPWWLEGEPHLQNVCIIMPRHRAVWWPQGSLLVHVTPKATVERYIYPLC